MLWTPVENSTILGYGGCVEVFQKVPERVSPGSQDRSLFRARLAALDVFNGCKDFGQE